MRSRRASERRHDDRLVVGYVHAGPPSHGVRRYGDLLAAAARGRSDVGVVEVDVELPRAALRDAWRTLAEADVVHLQYNNHPEHCIWGRRWRQFARLRALTAGMTAPLVVTVHDMYERPPWQGLGGFARARLAMAMRRVRVGQANGTDGARDAARRDRERSAHPDAATLWWLSRRASALVVCTEEERRRLAHFLPDARVEVVPHFVERRAPLEPTERARAEVGLAGRRVVTLLGFIHRRKGYDLLVDALPNLPPDVTVVFAGGPAPEHERYVEQLAARAAAHPRGARLHVTGHLTEAELERWMACTDLAVCPFASVAASSSLATWISAGRPILASALPLLAEYDRLVPGAIHTFAPYDAVALAQGIRALLARDERAVSGVSLGHLRDALSIESALDRHEALYRELCGLRAPAADAASASDPSAVNAAWRLAAGRAS